MNARSDRFDRDPAGWTAYLAAVETASAPFDGRYRLRHFDYVHPVRLQPGTPRRLQQPYAVPLAYTDWGPHDAPLVVCCGGVANVAMRFGPLALALAADHRVIGLDWAGRGRSAWLHEEADYSLASCVEQLRQLIVHVGRRPLTLVGSSLGGSAAIELAARWPRLVKRLVLNDIGPAMPAGRRRRRAETLARHYVFREPAELLRKLGAAQKNDGPASDAFRLFLAHHQTRWSEEEHGRVYRHDVRALQAYRRDARAPIAQWDAWQRVRAPVLLVHGLESDALSTATIRRMVRSRPMSVMHVPRTGHTPLLVDGHQIGFIHDWLRATQTEPAEWTALFETDQRAARQASTTTSTSLTANSAALAA
jgi:pimeloyl-ACP methyl ester carboxylesterase